MDWVACGDDLSEVFGGKLLQPTTSLEDLIENHLDAAESQFPSKSSDRSDEVVTVRIPKRKPKVTRVESPLVESTAVQPSAETDLTLREAMFEVKTFTIRSMAGSEKEAAEVQLAVSLGAKPPKRKFSNYTVVKADGKKQKLLAAEEKNIVATTTLKPKPKGKQKKKTKRN